MFLFFEKASLDTLKSIVNNTASQVKKTASHLCAEIRKIPGELREIPPIEMGHRPIKPKPVLKRVEKTEDQRVKDLLYAVGAEVQKYKASCSGSIFHYKGVRALYLEHLLLRKKCIDYTNAVPSEKKNIANKTMIELYIHYVSILKFTPHFSNLAKSLKKGITGILGIKDNSSMREIEGELYKKTSADIGMLKEYADVISEEEEKFLNVESRFRCYNRLFWADRQYLNSEQINTACDFAHKYVNKLNLIAAPLQRPNNSKGLYPTQQPSSDSYSPAKLGYYQNYKTSSSSSSFHSDRENDRKNDPKEVNRRLLYI